MDLQNTPNLNKVVMQIIKDQSADSIGLENDEIHLRMNENETLARRLMDMQQLKQLFG